MNPGFKKIVCLLNPGAAGIYVVAVGSPGVGVHDAVRVHVVPDFVDIVPSGGHDAVGEQVVPGVPQLQPAGIHGAVGVEIVPDVIHRVPAGVNHVAVAGL